MSTNNSRPPARIYTFPPRGHYAVVGRRDDSAPPAYVQMPRGVRVAPGSGWYHEEAIAAEERRKS